MSQQKVHFRSAIARSRGRVAQISNFELGAFTVCEMLSNCHMFGISNIQKYQNLKIFHSKLQDFETCIPTKHQIFQKLQFFRTLQASFGMDTCIVQSFEGLTICAQIQNFNTSRDGSTGRPSAENDEVLHRTGLEAAMRVERRGLVNQSHCCFNPGHRQEVLVVGQPRTFAVERTPT